MGRTPISANSNTNAVAVDMSVGTRGVSVCLRKRREGGSGPWWGTDPWASSWVEQAAIPPPAPWTTWLMTRKKMEPLQRGGSAFGGRERAAAEGELTERRGT